jgi:transcriptional regulator of heat shock response
MVRTVDHSSRRKAVLAATINKYIKQASPVASEDIADEFDLSSATIRNIFVELEQDGYLAHPYTSGGRMPTNKGYRYYVDFLTSQIELLDAEKEPIIREYSKQIDRLEDALEKTSELISAVTHYAGIVYLPQWQDKIFYNGISFILDQPEFHDFERMRHLIRMIENKRQLLEIINRDIADSVKIYIGEELDCPEMETCSLVVSTCRLKNKPAGRLAVLGPMRMEYNRIIPTLEYISEVFNEALSRI